MSDKASVTLTISENAAGEKKREGGLTDLAKHHAIGRVLDELQGDEVHSCEFGGNSLIGESTLKDMAVTTFSVV